MKLLEKINYLKLKIKNSKRSKIKVKLKYGLDIKREFITDS